MSINTYSSDTGIVPNFNTTKESVTTTSKPASEATSSTSSIFEDTISRNLNTSEATPSSHSTTENKTSRSTQGPSPLLNFLTHNAGPIQTSILANLLSENYENLAHSAIQIYLALAGPNACQQNSINSIAHRAQPCGLKYEVCGKESNSNKNSTIQFEKVICRNAVRTTCTICHAERCEDCLNSDRHKCVAPIKAAWADYVNPPRKARFDPTRIYDDDKGLVV